MLLSFIQRMTDSNASRLSSVVVAMFAFARIAGFAFGTPKPERARFDVMLGGSLCLMCLADDRYTGMQLMLLGMSLLLMLYNWAMVCNLKEGKAAPKELLY